VVSFCPSITVEAKSINSLGALRVKEHRMRQTPPNRAPDADEVPVLGDDEEGD
jgi:hypothetical protein